MTTRSLDCEFNKQYMKTQKNSKVTEKDRSVIGELFDLFGSSLSQAYTERPDFKEKLSHITEANIRYHLGRMANQSKGKTARGTKRARQENTTLIKVESKTFENQENNLNFCPCCGFTLKDVKTVMNLIANGKI